MTIRYSGEDLGKRPHIAVLFYDAIGDFVVITPLLRGLHEKYPDVIIDYFSGERTRQLEEACPYIDSRCSVFGNSKGPRGILDYINERESAKGRYDLAINCDFNPILVMITSLLNARYVVGKCYSKDMRQEIPYNNLKIHKLHQENWAAEEFTEKYSDILNSNFIGEIFCRLAYVETDYNRTEVSIEIPRNDVPEVLISTGGKRKAKLWNASGWKKIIDWCSENKISTGLLGDKPARQAQFYGTGQLDDYLISETTIIDLRGKMSLPQVAGALKKCRACVTVDNGLMHLSIAVGSKTIALFGASPWQLWTPQVQHLKIILPEKPCELCRQNSYKNEECLLDSHICMNSIKPEIIIEELKKIINP